MTPLGAPIAVHHSHAARLSIRAIGPNARGLAAGPVVDFLILSGRAVIYPIYQGSSPRTRWSMTRGDPRVVSDRSVLYTVRWT